MPMISTVADNYHLDFPDDSVILKITAYGLYLWDATQSIMYTVVSFPKLGSHWGDVAELQSIGINWFNIPIMTGVGAYCR